ncbi:permease [Halobacterium noricense]|uniref:permease n=1 Tax=Halobacterium noricense TaxID=223182 RepID=UPI001E30579E|nr:permease [Halobacterium noricense]UHH25679.1 permease [Halobacterium noricense]
MLSPGLSNALLDSWYYFLHLAVILVPLFIGASFLVGLAQEYLPPEKVERKLRGHDEGSGNVAAAGLGAVTPFCSCSTVPVLAGLLQAGAPLGLAFSFLLASPLVNEIAVILLIGLFGIEVTIWYVVITFVAAVVGGVVIGRLGLTEHVKDVRVTADTDQAVAADGGTVDCCRGNSADVKQTHRQHIGTAAREAWSFFVDTLPYLILGMTLGALIHGVVPVDMVHAVLGSENPLAVPLAAVAGAPVYISLSGMLPIAASLSEQGIAVGTVLAFIIGGAGVSIPNLILLNKLFNRRLLLVYAGTVVTIGIVVGVIFNSFIV